MNHTTSIQHIINHSTTIQPGSCRLGFVIGALSRHNASEQYVTTALNWMQAVHIKGKVFQTAKILIQRVMSSHNITIKAALLWEKSLT